MDGADPSAASVLGKLTEYLGVRGVSYDVIEHAETYSATAERVREVTGATHRLRLATEAEIARDLPPYEVGAVPPIGPGLPRIAIVDLRLLEHGRVVFAAGNHRHALLIPLKELLRVAEPCVADVCRTRE